MNTHTVHFLLDLDIHDGKHNDFERVVNAMVEGTRKESGAVAYEWFLSADGRRCRLLETYVDANAVQAHLAGQVVQQLVPKMLEFSSIARFEVYGSPDAPAAVALEAFGAEIFKSWKGLARSAAL